MGFSSLDLEDEKSKNASQNYEFDINSLAAQW